jgi:uncharacterized protein with NAD-binding domain and iron-sulfur cluster
MSDSTPERGRLLILGGGIASLTAAFYASEEGHEDVFPGGIHVYEMSARLGGKGASGRADSKAVKARIEEHGLHVWFGFYDNAFALLQKCHTYLDAREEKGKPRWATSLRNMEDSFRPCSRIALMDHDGSEWLPWAAEFPEDSTKRPWFPREPGERTLGAPTELVVRAVRMIEAFLFSLTGRSFERDDHYATFLDPSLLPIPVALPRLTWLSEALDQYLNSTTAETGGLEVLSRGLAIVARLLYEARSRFDELLRQHDALRRSWYIVDLLLAAVRGLVDDGVLITGDYTLIDDSELRAWLVLHGASEESVSCGFLKSIVYDLAFAYRGGNPDRPACSAATGAYGLLRVLLTYRGAIMWKMNAGMGEIVFAPIYEALIKRGVRFHFGHKVLQLDVDGNEERCRARSIVFEVRDCRKENGKLKRLSIESGPLAGYLPYWDDIPLRDGKLEKQVLLGPHDMVVYGIPVDTIEEVVPRRPRRWDACVNGLSTVGTLALQLWLREPVHRYAPWAAPDISVGAYTEPFDTWSDMKVLAGERTPGGKPPVQSVAYFTNVKLPTIRNDRDLSLLVDAFVREGLTGLWPGFEPGMVLDRYWRMNDEPETRYTLSVPGSLQARLSPLDKSIVNVRPVGDWTRNSISAGCIEAAVISGMIATLALRPDRELEIFGEDASKLAEKV